MKRGYIFLILLAFILTFVPSSAYAKTLAEVEFPDSVTVAGTELVLNGMGIRKATIFGIKVYVGGLYLEARENNAENILSSKARKQIVMHFVREVGREKITSGWDEGIENNSAAYTNLTTQISEFNGMMEDLGEGDEIVLTWSGDSVEVKIKNQLKGKISDAVFSKALLSVWLGANPPNAELKRGLLGLD